MVDLNKIIDYFKNSKIPENMLNRGQLVLNEFLNPLKVLFEQKALPNEGWKDEQIEFLLQILANMDTDKDINASQVGEREARIASKLHLNISGGFCHGVGRSGFLTAPQPKAPGGSIMYEITNYLARDIMRKFGLPNIKKAIITPIATGMSLALALSAFKPNWNNIQLRSKRKVLIPRLDHHSILKSIDFIGLEPKIIDGKIFGDAVRIPIDDIRNAYEDECYAIISFTSFFPPREADEIKEISKFAKEKDLVHIIVNAYGVQSPEWMGLIRSAIDAGKVDAVIQSTDKNFLTPVGASLIASPDKEKIEKISKTYAGRASASPVVNFLISMLSLGKNGYEKLIKDQQENRKFLEQKLNILAEKINERVMNIFNPVAVSMTLNHLKKDELYALGGALYNLRVTGPRVYDPSQKEFGTCTEGYPTPYIVMNAAIGSKKEHINTAIERLEKAYNQITK
ncbi:MAG: O-phosphoseryl-tRNA(Sec) selenium transferase [Promethearchaeati archaeon]